MSFVQIIDCHTTRIAEIQAEDAEWEKATEGSRTLRRQIVGRDRADADRYLVICFFDSYAEAKVNSELPATQESAARYTAMLDGPPTFLDLDVIEDRTLDEAAAAKPGFVQVFECRTSRIEDMSALDREYEQSVSNRTTVRRSLVTQDRADARHFVIAVFFDSYASAMENSNLPETTALAEKMGALLDEPPVFHDLDVIEDRTF